MEISVADAAARLQLSVQRVHQLLAKGELQGRQIGRQWVIEETQLRRRPLASRPLSDRMAWGLIDLLSGDSPQVEPSERYRLRKLSDRLRAAVEPAVLLRSWLRPRAVRLELSCPTVDLRELTVDPRIVRSGISDPRSGMSAGQELEGYVRVVDWPALQREFLMVPSLKPNVYLHLVERRVLSPVPTILVAADLAEHNGSREDSQVRMVLAGLR